MPAWLANDVVVSDARRACALKLYYHDAIGFVITRIAQFARVPGPRGWYLPPWEKKV
jgi:hypothetical protein